MNLYALIHARLGAGAANAAVVAARALLIVALVLWSDKSPQTFSYLRI